MKLTLLVLVTFSQLFGSWLCCCAPDRLVALFVQPVKTSVAKAPAKPCPHCKTAEPVDSEPTPAPVPSHPTPCPCGGLSIDVAPVLLAEPDSLTQVMPVLFVVESAFPMPPVSVTLTEVARVGPSFTTAQKLYTHHVLRC